MEDDDLKGHFDGIDRRLAEVDVRFDKVDRQFGEVNSRFNEMRQLILDEGKRTRRHFEIVAEGIKDEIKVIAEGHATLIAHNAVTDGRFQRLESEQERIQLRVTAVESRVGTDKTAQKIVPQPRRKRP